MAAMLGTERIPTTDRDGYLKKAIERSCRFESYLPISGVAKLVDAPSCRKAYLVSPLVVVEYGNVAESGLLHFPAKDDFLLVTGPAQFRVWCSLVNILGPEPIDRRFESCYPDHFTVDVYSQKGKGLGLNASRCVVRFHAASVMTITAP